MTKELFIPKMGQTVEEVILGRWLVDDGAKVSQGDEVIEVETDKAVFLVEANGRGYIHIGPYKEGQVVPVLTVVAIIGKEDEKFEVEDVSSAGAETTLDSDVATTSVAETVSALEVKTTSDGVFTSPRARKLATEMGIDPAQVTPTGYGGARVVERDVVSYLSQLPKATPVAQRMANAVGVDLNIVAGSGPGGRIVKQDVAQLADAGVGQKMQAPTQVSGPEVVERIPLKGVRKIIADRMGESVHTTARVTLLMEVDVTEFVAARERLKSKVTEKWGFAPGYNDLLAKIVATALRQFPYMNARLANDEIELLGHINIGMAVDTDRGLLVPVVRDADQKKLQEFGVELREMVERAHNSRSLPDDLAGGTFTITNLGMYDVDAFTPIINLPETAILGVGRITSKVVPIGSEIGVREMMTLSLVFDHRLVDGAPAARFLQYIKQLIEEPYLMLAA